VLGAAAVIVVLARHTLAKSLHVLATASLGWLLLALVAEAVSLTAFGMTRTLLLRVNGDRVTLGPVMAITYAAHALGLSIPFAGAELDVVYSYRQFCRTGLDAATTSWSMAVSWICSTASLALLLAVGAIAGSTSAASAAGYAGRRGVPAARRGHARLAVRFRGNIPRYYTFKWPRNGVSVRIWFGSARNTAARSPG
jgi:uncharacterized membrane protein YbhN (UPF0104 family)